RPPRPPTLYPYTTLFRSATLSLRQRVSCAPAEVSMPHRYHRDRSVTISLCPWASLVTDPFIAPPVEESHPHWQVASQPGQCPRMRPVRRTRSRDPVA